MPNQAEFFTMISLVFTGLVVMTLIQLSAAVVASKAFKFRVSGASIIASMTLAWPTSMMFLAFFSFIGLMPTVPENKWMVAFFMLVSVTVYIGWLWVFQPDTIEQLSLKKLKRLELKKNRIEYLYTMDKWKKMRKNNESGIDDVEAELVQNRLNKKEILNKYRRFKPITQWFR